MSDVDVMFVMGQFGQFGAEEMWAESIGASTWRGMYDQAHTHLMFKDVNPRIAMIHFSSERVVKEKSRGKEWEGEIIRVLPEQTRRVLVIGGINTPHEGKRVAIFLGADLIIGQDDLIGKPELMKEILQKGMMSPEEIEQRHQTMEIDGKREAATLYPERDDNERKWDYRDNYAKRK